MVISLDKPITPKAAAILGLIFCLPFTFNLFSAITEFEPFINLVSFNGRATTFGLITFYIALLALPLAFLVSLLSMLSVKLKLGRWSIEGKISFAPKTINLIIGVVSLLMAAVFGGHIIIDTLACFNGNNLACD